MSSRVDLLDKLGDARNTAEAAWMACASLGREHAAPLGVLLNLVSDELKEVIDLLAAEAPHTR